MNIHRFRQNTLLNNQQQTSLDWAITAVIDRMWDVFLDSHIPPPPILPVELFDRWMDFNRDGPDNLMSFKAAWETFLRKSLRSWHDFRKANERHYEPNHLSAVNDQLNQLLNPKYPSYTAGFVITRKMLQDTYKLTV